MGEPAHLQDLLSCKNCFGGGCFVRSHKKEGLVVSDGENVTWPEVICSTAPSEEHCEN